MHANTTHARRAGGALKRIALATVALMGMFALTAGTQARAAVSFAVDATKGSVSCYVTSSGTAALHLYENYDINGDGMADNGFFLWTSARGILQTSVIHPTATYNKSTNSAKFEGWGVWGTTPVYVNISVAPYSSFYPGYYKMQVIGYKVDAAGNVVKDAFGNPIVAYPLMTMYPKMFLNIP